LKLSKGNHTETCTSTKAQIIVHETMHRKLRLEQNEPH